MKKIAIVVISDEGKKTAKILSKNFKNSKLFFHSKETSLKDFVGEIFYKYDGIIFIMSLGIVVRVIAPYIKNKYDDPAIVAVDEACRFSISALSGHEGGANKLAFDVANILAAEPIITTATESQKKITLGIGACKNIETQSVLKAINYALKKTKYSTHNVRCIATIDLKMKEKGILEACAELDIPLRVISAKDVKAFNGDYTKSDFVKKKIGVEGVCEPCALLAGRRAKLILKKQSLNKVTIAVAKED